MSGIIIVRSSSIIHDSRVGKIVRSLKKRYSITVLGWNREGISAELIKTYTIPLKLFSLKAPFGKPSLVAYLPLFWIWIFFKLVIYRPQVVHACDFDTLMPCYLYKMLFRKKLIFDVFDRYGMIHLYKSKFLRSLINSLEESLGRRSDVLITTSQKFLESFRKKPKHYAIILNCPEKNNKERTRPNHNILTLVYTGAIERRRGLERITEVIKDLERVELVVAGKVIDEDFFQQITKLPNVKYHGLLLYADALELEANSDAMISLYDLTVPNYNLAIANKTFEAMMFGLPVITNIALELINETECGIVVDYNDLEQIKSAIVSLRDDQELCRRLGANGLNAFKQKYNWENMEQELYKIYDTLLR